MKKVFLYFHKNSFTKEVFYVGIGFGYRPFRKSGRSELWNRVVKKYGYTVEIVQEFDKWSDAAQKEKEYISKFGRIDNRTGILVNHTDGGDGVLGCHKNKGRKASEETKKKISDALRGRPLHPNTIAARKKVKAKSWNKGLPMTEETKAKLSNSKKGRLMSDDTKLKISAALKGRIFSEETRRKNSESLKGRLKSEVHKLKLSEAAKKQWNDGRCWTNKK